MSHPGTSITIRRAVVTDAPALAEFGRRTFHDTFAPDNDPADMAAYLAEAFAPEKQAAQLAAPGRTCLFAEVDGALVGYACLMDGAQHRDAGGAHPVELERFYVDRRWHGRGVAAPLMMAVVQYARAVGADVLWLGVWERNARAIAYYRKQGFERVGAQTFHLGADVQTDDVMRRAL